MSGDYSQIKFIDGTMSSQTYAVFGRQKANVMGVRPLGISPTMLGKAKKVFVYCRLRSASGAGLFDEAYSEDGEDNGVITFATKSAMSKDWAALWPNIKFEKKNDERASSIFGAYIDGDLDGDPMAFVQKMNDEKILEAMANAIIAAVGEEYLCVRKSLFVAWFVEKQGELMMKMIDHVIEKKKMQAQFMEIASDGSFGSHHGTLAEKNASKPEADPSSLLSATITAFPGAAKDDEVKVHVDPMLADLLKAQTQPDDVFNKTSPEAQKSKALFGTAFDHAGGVTGTDLSSLGSFDEGEDDPEFDDDEDNDDEDGTGEGFDIEGSQP